MSPPFHIEVVQKPNSHVSADCIKTMVNNYLSNFETVAPGLVIPNSDFAKDIELSANVFSITFCEERDDSEPDLVSITDSAIVYHVYKLNGFGEEQIDAMTDTIGGEEVTFAALQVLPFEGFHGLWESLVYDSQLKQETLRFVETAFEFADRGVDSNIIGWNHVVLFHGPPGTGKTSLCRALAQKLAIRHAARFPRACLLEINAHSLFSKWFSESGKLVAKLFERVRELVEDKRMLVCLLVDEVESLAQARSAAMSGVEPSDSIRAVNALLTQLDRLKRYPNALALTTSNVTGAIDVAFLDRADIKRRVGPPTERAAFKILCGCLGELMARGVLPQTELGELASLRLREVAKSAAERRLSARALRRLPFLARALHAAPSDSITDFLDALRTALLRHLADAADLDDPRPNGDHHP